MPGLRYWDGSAWQPVAPAPSQVLLDPWHTVGAAGEPAFTGGWVVQNAAVPPQFRKSPFGKVQIRGIVKSGGVGTANVIFTLPAGYRPPQQFTVQNGASGGEAVIAVLPDGRVFVNNYMGAGTNTFVYLDDIEFDTDTVTSYAAGQFGQTPILTQPSIPYTFPSNPAIGDQFILRFQQNVLPADPKWITWLLRFDETGYWIPVGQPEPIVANNPANNGMSCSANVWFTQSSGTEPEVVLPFSADWMVEWSVGQFWINAVGNWYVAAWYHTSEQTNNGTAPVSDIASMPGTGTYGGGQAQKRMTAGAKDGSNHLKLKYYSTSGGSVNMGSRTLKIWPRRIYSPLI